jgi:hypothetical protein
MAKDGEERSRESESKESLGVGQQQREKLETTSRTLRMATHWGRITNRALEDPHMPGEKRASKHPGLVEMRCDTLLPLARSASDE